MKIILMVFATVAIVFAEPPAPNQNYLPSNQNQYSTTSQDNFAPPSSQYGAPNAQAPSRNYGAPNGQAPSRNYGAPSSNYGAPSNGQTTAVLRPNTQYSAPQASSNYLPPTGGNNGYSNNGGNNGYSNNGGSNGYSHNGGSNGYSNNGGNNGYSNNGGYASNGGYGDEQNEPANYNFKYDVQDAESGNDFGHEESRQGDVAKGKYYVLLPDGRRQVVEYTADNEGYKPKISYEQVGGGYQNGGYPSGGGNGNGGYSNGGGNGNGGYSNGGGNGNGNGNGGYNY